MTSTVESKLVKVDQHRMGDRIYNLYEAKTSLSSLVERAASGEEIVIAKAGVPMVRLVPVRRSRERRKPGGARGEIWISPDFDDPLPEDIRTGFEGGGDEDA